MLFLLIKKDFSPYKNKIIRLGSSDIHEYKNMIKYTKFLPFINNSQRIIDRKWLLENGRCIYEKGFNNLNCIIASIISLQ
ncbi:hypothetical protein CON11_02050 [Priestia megaterium]|nr:hypothetical protein CON11_02050 [Priestia megaterium]